MIRQCQGLSPVISFVYIIILSHCPNGYILATKFLETIIVRTYQKTRIVKIGWIEGVCVWERQNMYIGELANGKGEQPKKNHRT